MILPRILVGHEYWLRLATLFHLYNERLYNQILHTSCKLPSNPKLLYKAISKKKYYFKHLLKFEKLSQEQYDTIFPKNEETDITKFDVTTFVAIVRYCTKLKPRDGWVLVRQLSGADRSKGAFLLELEQYFKENLEDVEPISYHRFEDDWNELIYIINGLKFNTKEVDDLKTCEINSTCLPNKYVEAIMKAQLEFVRSTQRMNASKIRTLRMDDEKNEIEADIAKLLDRSYSTERTIDKLYELISKPDDWKLLFLKLAEVDETLMEVRAKIDFLQELMNLEHASILDKDSNEDLKKDDEEKEIEKDIDETDKKAGNESNDKAAKELNGILPSEVTRTSQVSSKSYPCIDTRIHLATKKLKTFYAYAFNKNEFLRDNGCCRQSYTELDLLRRRQDKWIQSNRSMRESNKVILPVEEKVKALEDIFEYNNHVLLKGIAGIGKTYLIRELVSKWVHGCLFSEIAFLFVLSYNDAKLNPDCKNLEELLENLFPHIFSTLTISEILSEPDKVLIIFDGWGKLERLDYVQIEEKNGIYSYQPNVFGQLLFDGINSETGLFKDSYTITTTRPEFFLALRESLSNFKISEIEVLGFTDQSCSNFIFDVFSGNKTFLAIVKQRIEQHVGLESLMKIPLNVSMFCMIQMHNEQIDSLKTETELYLWKLSLLLQEKSYEAEMNKQVTDLKMFDNSIALTSVIEAAQLCYNAQMGGVENSDSFFVDHNLQEFLTSIYVCVLNINSVEIKQDHRLRSCLPFVSGLQGLSGKPHAKYSCLMQNFIKNLNVLHLDNFMNDLFNSYLPGTDNVEKITLQGDFLHFLECYYEFQIPLNSDEISESTIIDFKFHDMLPRDVSNLIYFLDNERFQLRINSIELHTMQTISIQQMNGLFQQLLTIPIVKLDIKSFKSCSEEFSNVLECFKSDYIALKDFYILQKCEYQEDINVNFDWICYLKTINVHLITNRNSQIIKNLKPVITKALREKKRVCLNTFKLTVATSDREILPSILDLLTNYLYIKEIHLYITEQKFEEIKEPYQNHRSVESVDITEISSIKQALYKGLNANSFPKNLKRLFIKDKYCGYQFVVNKPRKHIVFSTEEARKSYIEIDVVNL